VASCVSGGVESSSFFVLECLGRCGDVISVVFGTINSDVFLSCLIPSHIWKETRHRSKLAVLG
jgi:hypothetical protein